MRGNITRRGKCSWRLKFDVEQRDGARQTRYVTVKGTRKDAEAELARVLHAVNSGVFVDPTKMTVAAYLRSWLSGKRVSPATAETYSVIVELRLIPAIGHIEIQKLRPVQVKHMLDSMLSRGGRNDAPLAVSTVRQAHRVLRGALQAAVDIELLSRNVAAIAKSPPAEAEEVPILGAAEITALLVALRSDALFPIVSLALATGMRRGELLALRWRDVDLDGASVKVTHSLEHTTKGGYRFKPPKTKHGRRIISLPPSTIDILRDHKVKQLELRLQLGMGKPGNDALVFCGIEGKPLSPDHLSVRWRRALAEIAGLPAVTFHALRHAHASALISAGVDVVTVSRRLGHGSPAITLSVYAHLFAKTDVTAAAAIGKVLG